jgi:hypothetical protein
MTNPSLPTATNHLGHTAWVACLALLGAAVQAQPVADPTRPSAALLGDAPVAKTGTAATPRPVAAAAPAALPPLRSVQIPQQGPPSALLGGRVVRVGDHSGEHRVVAIDSQGVTLRGPRGEQRLALFAGITKSASRDTAAPRAALAPESVTRSQDTP